jgi:hypothetical protein
LKKEAKTFVRLSPITRRQPDKSFSLKEHRFCHGTFPA